MGMSAQTWLRATPHHHSVICFPGELPRKKVWDASQTYGCHTKFVQQPVSLPSPEPKPGKVSTLQPTARLAAQPGDRDPARRCLPSPEVYLAASPIQPTCVQALIHEKPGERRKSQGRPPPGPPRLRNTCHPIGYCLNHVESENPQCPAIA